MRSLRFRLPLAIVAAAGVATSGALGCAKGQGTPPSTQAQPGLVIDTNKSPPERMAPLAMPVPATFDVAALSERVKPFVVNITTSQKVAVPDMGLPGMGRMMDPFEFFFGRRGDKGPVVPRERSLRRQALGTGVIIDPTGYVVTNEHVIHDADEVRIHLWDDREYKADVVGRDSKLDIALLKFHAPAGLAAAPLGSSDQLRVGEYVLAVGNPFGLGHTVTLGIVSAKARTIGAGPYDDFIQTDASINPGNSGGPLFNWRGEVVGINTAMRQGASGIGFAIPIDEVKNVVPQLRETGHVRRGRLGIAFQPITPDLAAALGLSEPHGALVAEVEPGGAGARAGIKTGDVIVAVNGTPVQHSEELPRRVASNAPGTTITLTVLRDQQRRDLKATLDVLPDTATQTSGGPGLNPGPANNLGIQVSEAPDGKGVRVDEVDNDNVRDLSPGDVIVEMNGAPVKDVASLRAAVAKAKPGSTALMKVKRGQVVLFAAVPISGK